MDTNYIAEPAAEDQPSRSFAKLSSRSAPVSTNRFRSIAALGYTTLLPIVPPGAPLSERSSLSKRLKAGKDSRGKAPGVKGADGDWRGVNWPAVTQTPVALDEWHLWNASVGLKLGHGQCALDFDILDEGLCKRLFTLLCQIIPGEHRVRWGRKPKFLVLVACAGELPYRTVEFGAGQRVEFLGLGKQCVVAGPYPAPGMTYEWAGGMPRADALVVATPNALTRFFDALAALPEASSKVIEERVAGEGEFPAQASLVGPLETVRKAVAAMPNTTAAFPLRKDYLKVGYAIKAALPDHPNEAYEIYEDWCSRWEDPPTGEGNDFGVASDDWARMRPPFKIGARWLYQHASLFGDFDRASEFLTPIAEVPPSLFDVAPSDAEEPQFAALSIRRIDAELDVRSIPTRRWIIAPWCPAFAVCAIVGAPGVSKSAFALMLAAGVASGDETVLRGAGRFSSERLHRPGPVIVYNGEDDQDEMQRRIVGLRKHHGLAVIKHPLIAISGVDRRLVIVERKEASGAIRRAPGFAQLQALIRAHRPVLVILDPLVSLSSGLIENSNDDMEALFAELRALTASEGTTILVVHHAGKNADKASGDLNASRGASAIMGAVRGGITLTAVTVGENTPQDGPLKGLPVGRYVLAEGIKANYGPKAEPSVYRLRSVPVGNGTGEPLPSSADLLFDDGDPEAFLVRNGDTVAVHDIVDRRGASARAKADAVAQASSEAVSIAGIVAEELGDRAEAAFTSIWQTIGERFQASGIKRGTSRQIVSEKLQSALSGRGVEIEHDGKRVVVCMSKDHNGATAPWILRVFDKPEEQQANGFFDLFD